MDKVFKLMNHTVYEFIQAFIQSTAFSLDTTINLFKGSPTSYLRHHYTDINDRSNHFFVAFTYYMKNKLSLQKCPVNIDEWKEYIGTFCNEHNETDSFFLILALLFIVRSHFAWPMVWTEMRYYAFKIVMDSIQKNVRQNPEECVVCYELTNDVTITCKHDVCATCQRRLTKCPYCRQRLIHYDPRMVTFIRDVLFFSPLDPWCTQNIFCPKKFYKKNRRVRKSSRFKLCLAMYFEATRSSHHVIITSQNTRF